MTATACQPRRQAPGSTRAPSNVRATVLCPRSQAPGDLTQILDSTGWCAARYLSDTNYGRITALADCDLAILLDHKCGDSTEAVLDIPQINEVVALLKRSRVGALVLTERPWLFADTDVPWVCVPMDVSPGMARGALQALAQLRSVFQQIATEHAGTELVTRRMHSYLGELDYELRLAARLQAEFLPKELPEIGPIRFATMFRPTAHVSGDLYDVFRLDETHIGFYLSDAVGHGVSAGLLTMFIKHAIQPKRIFSNRYEIVRPSEVVTSLNERLVAQRLPDSQFVTGWYGVIDVKTLRLDYAVAGHPRPFLLEPDGRVSELLGDGCLLGVFANQTYRDYSVRLRPGQRVMLYSDGLENALIDERRPGPEMPIFLKGVEEMLGQPTKQLIASLDEVLDTQPGGLTQADDVSAVILEIEQ